MNHLTCKKCGWVHFEISRKDAEAEVARFNEYFDSLTKEDQINFYRGKKSSIESYENCFRCQTSHEQARISLPEEIPFGSTVQPLITPTDFRKMRD